ncbi:hypothetical protein WJX72_009250 [[Myrmecia] bisecta]|uniref:Uncharacterized protein n=1 Tax=[Myrmecia] bisecta TaxID=41462 RepID=A0AAW1PXW8_9CHLO
MGSRGSRGQSPAKHAADMLNAKILQAENGVLRRSSSAGPRRPGSAPVTQLLKSSPYAAGFSFLTKTSGKKGESPFTIQGLQDAERAALLRAHSNGHMDSARTLQRRMSGSTVVGPESRLRLCASRQQPSVMLVQRTPAARDAEPRRLDLDHQDLTQCCILEGEEKLRLLNYQHNSITAISRLEGLRQLEFLHLYSNCLESIAGLASLANLRVLMLGRNYIRQVRGLEALVNLDVLDLHSNLIDQLDGLQAVRKLRILNVAGNRLRQLDNLAHLTCLAELNLCRNFVSTLRGPDSAPQQLPASLQKLFVSHNRITGLDGIAGALMPLTQLVDLALDGNPLASGLPLYQYQMGVLSLAPASIQTLDAHPVTEPQAQTPGAAEFVNGRKLCILGNATHAIRLPSHNTAQEVLLKFTSWTDVTASLPSLAGLPKLRKLTLQENGIASLQQVAALSSLTSLRELSLTRNAVADLGVFRPYTAFCLPHLQVINDEKVTEEERARAASVFKHVRLELEAAATRPAALMSACIAAGRGSKAAPDAEQIGDESSRTQALAGVYWGRLVDNAKAAVNMVVEFEEVWPHVVDQLLLEGLLGAY